MTKVRRGLVGLVSGVLLLAVAAPAGAAEPPSTVQAGPWQTLADKIYTNAAGNYNTLVS